MLRLATYLILTGVAANACDCGQLTVSQAKKSAELVFRGRITGFRHDAKGDYAVFAVDRVWKGKVPRTFEMPAIREGVACLGFWPDFLQVGKYLLVYAYRLDRKDPDYITNICNRTTLVEYAKDFEKLGAGYSPTGK